MQSAACRGTLGLLAALVLPLASAGAAAEGFGGVLTGGDPILDVRMRYAHVDQDNDLRNADALTLRARLGYETGRYNGLGALLEFEGNAALLNNYNSGPGGNGRSDFSVVADPETAELNRGWLGFDGIPGTPLKLGRQRIILDNARFVGNVGFRQLEQTFDAFRLDNGSLPDTALLYSYVDNVRDIFSRDVDTRSHLIHARYEGSELGKLTAYGYLLELPETESNSQQTYGIRFQGRREFSGRKLLYMAEYAKQDAYKGGDDGIDADYWHLLLGLAAKGISGKLGYEVLGADDYSGFETPFATKHLFNGLADLFLNTPKEGLRDACFSLGGKVAGVGLQGVYHDFQADEGGANYGRELDLSATWAFREYKLGLIYANYDADEYAVDTEKFWVWASLGF